MIEAGSGYMRFFTEAGQVEVDEPVADIDFVRLSTYKWFESTDGFDEWYCALPDGTDASIAEPDKFYEQSILMTSGIVGSLERGEWAFADNDTLGFNTIYVRLTLRE
jgi:hypothetical protein